MIKYLFLILCATSVLVVISSAASKLQYQNPSRTELDSSDDLNDGDLKGSASYGYGYYGYPYSGFYGSYPYSYGGYGGAYYPYYGGYGFHGHYF